MQNIKFLKIDRYNIYTKWPLKTTQVTLNRFNLCNYSFAENIALNKAVHYGAVRKDANVVVDGRKSYNDGQCLSTNSQSKLLIDLEEILSIHYITTYIKVTSGDGYLGIYIFFTVPFFCLVLFCMLMKTVSSTECKTLTFLQRRWRHETIQS